MTDARKPGAADPHADKIDDLVESLSRLVIERRAGDDLQGQLAAIVENSEDAIFSRALDGTIISWNAGAERLFGYPAAEAVGRDIAMLVPPERMHEYADHVAALRQGRAVPPVETVRRARDGRLIEVSMGMSPIRDRNGEVASVAVIARDISERKRLDEELRAHRERLEELVAERTAELQLAKNEAERANAAKSEFLSRMSHEFRTPMNAILGFSRVLEEELTDPDQHDYVMEIIQAGDHLLGMIDRLLDFSRIENGQAVMGRLAVPVGPIVAEAARLVEPLLREARLTLVAGCPGADGAPGRLACPSCQGGMAVLADAERLAQILECLLSNAVQYSRRGGEIWLACVPIGEAWARFSVTDQGAGIAREKLERLFMPFDRLGAEASRPGAVGIGLAFAKRLAELMGGRIGVESTAGQGATFWVELPRAPVI
ncbi:MAG TPA: PAS domain S-box protein [Rhodocyclaceae bacterium]